MIHLKNRCSYRLSGFFLFVSFLPVQAQEDEEIYDMSPFVIEEADSPGYLATTTLAGTRIQSNLRDLGASIALITQEFMQDIAATDGESLLAYVGNVEVAGMQGNYSGVYIGPTQGNFANVDLSLPGGSNDPRVDPESGQRIRGLEAATLTRGYFQTNIPFDTYNTERVTVNRGPNSILFGLGTAGGVINNNLSQGRINRNFGKISVRLDHRGGHREEFSYNKNLIKDRLAVRIAVKNERIQYKQEPAFEKDKRLYLAWNLALLENEKVSWLGRTSIRGSYETGEELRNPPDTVPPLDGFSHWFEGIGGQEELNNLLRVPGIFLFHDGPFNPTQTSLRSNVVKKEWVLGAIEAGLVKVPEGMTAEQLADREGKFIPKFENNRFQRPIETLRSTLTSLPYGGLAPINFNSLASGTDPGWQDPELAGIQGIWGTWRPIGARNQTVRWSNTFRAGPGFTTNSLQNREVFDYHNLLFQGSTNQVTTEFDAQEFFLEQGLFGGKAGLELAWNKQTRERSSQTGFSGSSKILRIDITSDQPPADSDFDGVADRLPNENVGRPVAYSGNSGSTNSNRTEQETFRATFYGTLDMRDFFDGAAGEILGSHTFTGLFEDRTNDRLTRSTRGVWWADQGEHPSDLFGDNSDGRRRINSVVYLGPDARGLSSPDEMRIDGYPELRLPQVGDTYGIWYWDDTAKESKQNNWRIIDSLQNASINRTVLETKAATLQSKFLWDNLVGMYAVRKDEEESFRRIRYEEFRGPTGSLSFLLDDPGINESDGNFNEALLVLEDEPIRMIEDETTTWNIVGHYPENWLGDLPWGMDLSAHYYEADSFEPVGNDVEVNVYNEPLPNQTGVTREWGLTLGLMENRLAIQFSKFKTSLKNVRTGGPISADTAVFSPIWYAESVAIIESEDLGLFPSPDDTLLTPFTDPDNTARTTGTDADLLGITSFDEYYERLFDVMPTRIRDILNPEVVRNENGTVDIAYDELDGNLAATHDHVAEGMEIDVVGRITDNWSLSLNVAKQETVASNYAPDAFPLFNEVFDRWDEAGFLPTRAEPASGIPYSLGFLLADEARGFRLFKALEGRPTPEQRKWRVNLTSRYDFREGFLKGFSVGGSLRYQDEVAAGYPTVIDEFGDPNANVETPFLGPEELNGDLFIRYRKKLSEKLDWSIQFNTRNLYRKNGDDDIPVFFNPDGRVARIRIPNPREFYLSNTFRF